MSSSSASGCANDPARLPDTPAPPPALAVPPVAIVVDDATVLRLLRAAVAAAGSQRAYADRVGISQGDLSSALSGRRPPTAMLRRSVGVEAALVMRGAAR